MAIKPYGMEYTCSVCKRKFRFYSSVPRFGKSISVCSVTCFERVKHARLTDPNAFKPTLVGDAPPSDEFDGLPKQFGRTTISVDTVPAQRKPKTRRSNRGTESKV